MHDTMRIHYVVIIALYFDKQQYTKANMKFQSYIRISPTVIKQELPGWSCVGQLPSVGPLMEKEYKPFKEFLETFIRLPQAGRMRDEVHAELERGDGIYNRVRSMIFIVWTI